MNTQHLKYAVEVARTGSITQAAENLYIGQPSLSKAIRELEDSLGITIFKRSSRGATPTEQGAEFLKYARAVLVQVEKMETLYRPAHSDGQRLALAIPRSAYIAGAATEMISRLDPGKELDVDLRETGAMDAVTGLAEGRGEIAVIRYQARNERYFMDYLEENGLKSEPVWQFEAMVVFSRRHPLAEVRPLRAEDLFPFVEIRDMDVGIPYTAFREGRRPDMRADKRLSVYDRLNQYDMLSRIPGAYLWEAPMPEEILTQWGLRQRICALPEQERYCDAIIYPQGHEFTGLEKRFINLLYERKNALALRVYE